ncbi:MAG: sporulation protein [Thermocrispum sp.]
MFQKVLASFGSGGAQIDCRILDRTTHPGRPLRGEVQLLGGEVEQAINALSVSLMARTQAVGERGQERTEDVVFGTQQLVGRELVRPGQQIRVPFEVPLPWEMPISSFFGKPLTGVGVGLQTTLDIENAVADPVDLDAAAVEPLPVQKRILDAVSKIGFTFSDAVLRKGQIGGTSQSLPFYQEIRFAPSPRFAKVFTRLAITFLTRADHTQVILDVNKKVRVSKSGGFAGAADYCGSFGVKHNDPKPPAWEQQLEGWLHELAKPRGIFD